MFTDDTFHQSSFRFTRVSGLCIYRYLHTEVVNVNSQRPVRRQRRDGKHLLPLSTLTLPLCVSFTREDQWTSLFSAGWIPRITHTYKHWSVWVEAAQMQWTRCFKVSSTVVRERQLSISVQTLTDHSCRTQPLWTSKLWFHYFNIFIFLFSTDLSSFSCTDQASMAAQVWEGNRKHLTHKKTIVWKAQKRMS